MLVSPLPRDSIGSMVAHDRNRRDATLSDGIVCNDHTVEAREMTPAAHRLPFPAAAALPPALAEGVAAGFRAEPRSAEAG